MSSEGLIQPRTLKGFRDFFPERMIPRERIIETAKQVYRSFGYSPIDTPALEYLEILVGKGGHETDKQLYRFEDHGGRSVGMRFDLTVPLARFVAQHVDELGTPFKRYHVGYVWRGEKPHRGRYREFVQCDFDTVGTQSLAADIETGLVIYELLRTLGFQAFTLCVNHRQILGGLLEKLELTQKATEILRALDKLSKIERGKVAQEMMRTASVTAEQAEQVLCLADISGSNEQVLDTVELLVQDSPLGETGVEQLTGWLAGIRAGGVPDSHVRLDVSIARGLDYYTGTVLETILDELPNIGSVCSGGRYDNLAELYTRRELPGVGASLGVDRLLAAMEELGMVAQVQTPATVFVPYFSATRLHNYLALAAEIRRAGLGVELFPESTKLGQQLKYADRRGFRVALILGEDELRENECQVKNLVSRSTTTVSLAKGPGLLIDEIRRILAEDDITSSSAEP